MGASLYGSCLIDDASIASSWHEPCRVGGHCRTTVAYFCLFLFFIYLCILIMLNFKKSYITLNITTFTTGYETLSLKLGLTVGVGMRHPTLTAGLSSRKN